MAGFDQVIEAVTQRLRVDPELQLDVAHELRTHLEESAAEYRTAGYGEDEAIEQAIGHLGDQAELAADLWKANRGRMRLRGVLRWAARVLLLPAAIVVTVWAGPWGSGVTARHLYSMISGDSFAGEALHLPGSHRELALLTPDQRYVLRGDPEAKTDLERAKSIADRWPDNPIYYGNYANLALIEFHHQAQQNITEAEEWYRPLLERGKSLEPSNGYYDLAKAFALVDAAAQDVSATTKPASESDNAFQPSRIVISDAKRFEESLKALHDAVGKPFLDTHAVDMARIRLDLLPPPRTLVEYTMRTALLIGLLLPDLGGAKRLARLGTAYAWELAEHGEVDKALALLNDVDALGGLYAANADCLIQLLVGQSITTLAGEYRSQILQRWGTAEQAAAAEKDLRAMKDIYARIHAMSREKPVEYLRRAGVFNSIMVPAVAGFEPDPYATRQAEQVNVERFGLVGLLMMLDGLAVAAGGLGLLMMLALRHRRQRPILAWIGWRRIGWIALWGVATPLLAYGLYSLSPLANREFGVNYMPERFVVELLAVALLILLLVDRLTVRAIGQRARELGVGASEDRAGRFVRAGWWILAGIGVCVLAYLGAWQFEVLRPRSPDGLQSWLLDRTAERLEWLRVAGSLLAVALVLVAVMWLIVRIGGWIWLAIKDRQLAGTMARSAMPALAAVIIVFGLGSGWLLRQAEATALAHIRSSEDMTMMREVSGSAYQQLKEFHAERLADLRAREASPVTKE